MIRNEKLEDISDGRLYDANDMVKAYCNECKGCHACCTGMGNSIILDPMDVMRLCRETGKNFTQLLEKELEVNVVDGLVLPNIKMTADKCPFLNEEGRCSIHSARPGFCRLFPLPSRHETIIFFMSEMRLFSSSVSSFSPLPNTQYKETIFYLKYGRINLK